MRLPSSGARGELFEPADELWKHGRIESLADHQHILAAIRARDAEGAATAMAEHIERTRLEVRALVRQIPHESLNPVQGRGIIGRKSDQ